LDEIVFSIMPRFRLGLFPDAEELWPPVRYPRRLRERTNGSSGRSRGPRRTEQRNRRASADESAASARTKFL
jgi:hypothetical protein